MLSKWLDVGMNLAAFHYQCRQYQKVRPPAFGRNPNIRNMTRERERQERMTEEETRAKLLIPEEEARLRQNQSNVIMAMWQSRRRQRQKEIQKMYRKIPTKCIHLKTPRTGHSLPVPSQSPLRGGRNRHQRGETRPSQQFPTEFLQDLQQEQTQKGGVVTPSLFLQESAHLLSLLSAVAMSTLRSDNLEAEPPLVEHIPGRPWPPVDPDRLSPEIRAEFNEPSRFWTAVRFLFGLKRRSQREVTLYNAARPLRVLGGVSDDEMEALRMARGPEAKVTLCSMWLQEFITREYLSGSTGGVAQPIISRLYQFTSDGNLGYNQCRKITYIPFPFPHAQLSIYFIGVCVFVFPLLYFSYVTQLAYACILNFITVMCFVGVNEVARELDSPFRNVPNDLPLTTFQAQFNEALIAMYAGFHPDAWSVEDQVSSAATSAPQQDQDESTVRDSGESADRRASEGSLDLLAFFRKEREESDKKSKQGDGDESPPPPPSNALSPIHSIVKSTTAKLFGDSDGKGKTNPPGSPDRVAFWKKTSATLFGHHEENDSVKEKVARSPEPKSLLEKAPAGATEYSAPSILKKANNSSFKRDGDKTHVDLETGSEKHATGE